MAAVYLFSCQTLMNVCAEKPYVSTCKEQVSTVSTWRLINSLHYYSWRVVFNPSLCVGHTVGVVISAVGKQNQTIDGQTTLKAEKQVLLECCALCWAQETHPPVSRNKLLDGLITPALKTLFIDASVVVNLVLQNYSTIHTTNAWRAERFFFTGVLHDRQGGRARGSQYVPKSSASIQL